MAYAMITQDKEGAVLPPCKACGSNIRFRFDKDYYSKGKLFCACEKTDFIIGGIRSREGVEIPEAAILAVKKKMEEYGFKDVVIITPDTEKVYNYPTGYRRIIKASGHNSPQVYLEILNNRKPERAFAATYEYGSVVMEHAPFSNWASHTWDWVERPQRSNKDLTGAVYRYLTRDISREAASDFHATKWSQQVIFKGEDFEAEQARKVIDAIVAEKAQFRSNVNGFRRRISEHELAVDRLLKQIHEAREDFKAAYGEEL